MTFHFRFLLPLAAVLGLALAGCMPPPTGAANEEKEPYFRKGEELAASQDLPGAMDAFEKTLEVNPHNALAHYRLGLLYEKEDPATAMYHFNRFLKRSPDPALAERARERVTACRTALAQTVALSMMPSTDRLQKEMERLTLENRDLKQRVDGWEKYAARVQQQQPASPPELPRSGEPPVPNLATSAPPRLPETPVLREAQTRSEPPPPAERMPALRTHRVRSGETPTSIAKKYNVNVNALLRANPRLEARRMKPGDAVTIPAR